MSASQVWKLQPCATVPGSNIFLRTAIKKLGGQPVVGILRQSRGAGTTMTSGELCAGGKYSTKPKEKN